jgi:glutathione S-transferase
MILKHYGIEFREIKLTLDTPQFRAQIGQYSGALRVPVLLDGELQIWDSLAIAEYLNEKVQGRAWPSDPALRAHARSVSAEMHSGFMALRQNWPMKATGSSRVELPAEGRADVARIEDIWRDCRTRYQARGPWLFGEYSIADAMYAPVTLRFKHYGAVLVNGTAQTYYRQLLQDEYMQTWIREAEDEARAPGKAPVGK